MTAVRLDGSYSDTCPPEILKSARRVIELGDDRPYLGFSKWTYDFEFGYNLHRSRAEALQEYAQQASHRRDQAERERNTADKQVQWALAQASTTTEDVPLSSSNRPTAAVVAAANTENAP